MLHPNKHTKMHTKLPARLPALVLPLSALVPGNQKKEKVSSKDQDLLRMYPCALLNKSFGYHCDNQVIHSGEAAEIFGITEAAGAQEALGFLPL